MLEFRDAVLLYVLGAKFQIAWAANSVHQKLTTSARSTKCDRARIAVFPHKRQSVCVCGTRNELEG